MTESWRLRGTRRAQRGWGPPAPRSPGAARSVRPARSSGPAAPRTKAVGHCGEPGHGESSRRSPFPTCLRAHRCPTSGRERAGAASARPGAETFASGMERRAWFDGTDDSRAGASAPSLPPGRTGEDEAVSALCRSARGCGCQSGLKVGPGIGGGCQQSREPQGMSIRIGHLRQQPLSPPGKPRTPTISLRPPGHVTRPYSGPRLPWPAPAPASPTPCGMQGPGAADGGRAEPGQVRSVGAPQPRGWGGRSTICW